MPSDTSHVHVSGTVRPGGLMLLSARLNDHDTFLTGTLRLGTTAFPVHILTFDDVTFLRPVDATEILPASSAAWSGVLHISHGLRDHELPADLIDAAAHGRRDLTTLHGRELQYALTFLNEATTAEIRRKRIDAIVRAMPPVHRVGEPSSRES